MKRKISNALSHNKLTDEERKALFEEQKSMTANKVVASMFDNEEELENGLEQQEKLTEWFEQQAELQLIEKESE